jgi:hypothetical protein
MTLRYIYDMLIVQWKTSLGANSLHDKLRALPLHLIFSTSFLKIQIQMKNLAFAYIAGIYDSHPF